MSKVLYTPIKLAGLSLGILSFFIISLMDLAPGQIQTTYMLAIAVLMAIWWMTEAVPIAITALLPVVLFPLFGIMNGKDVSSTYFNHIIFLFIGGFIVALAMEKWDLHRRIALKILLLVGVSPNRILIGFMLATAFLSMWISNTATAMMMVPIALSVISQLEENIGSEYIKKYSVALLLGIAYSASIGGIATLIGTPPNIAFSQIYSQTFPSAQEISFAQWIVFALPLSIIMLFFAWLFLYLIFVPKISFKGNAKEVIKRHYSKLGRITYEQIVVLIGFVLLAFLWLFRSGFDISIGHKNIILPGWSKLFAHPEYFNDGTAAMFIALLLFIIPSKNDKSQTIMDCQTLSKLPWNIVLLFGGGFALAKGFSVSGLSMWIAQRFHSLTNLNLILIVLIISTVVVFLTEFTSNTATTQMFLPILSSIAIGIHIDPLILMIPATISASLAFMLPIATPPNIIIFGSGRVRIVDMMKVGIFLNLIGIIVILLILFLIIKPVLGI